MFAFGQTTTGDDYKKVEGYVGYSNGQVDTGADSGSSVNDFFRDRRNFHGVNVSGVYNFNRYLGVKGDVSGTFNNERFTSTVNSGPTAYTVSAKTNNQLWNFVGGVQLKDNAQKRRVQTVRSRDGRCRTFRSKISDFTCSPALTCPVIPPGDDTFSETGFSGVFGGGVDFKVSDRFQIRAIQVDYNPIRVFGQTDHNLRLGAGIVF